MAIIDKKQTRWYAKSTFDSLDKTTIPVGTEIQVAGEIEETDLTADLQTKINGKLTAPTTPTADSVVTMAANGTTGTKALSELGGKLYEHYIEIYVSNSNKMTYLYFYFINSNSSAYTIYDDIYNAIHGNLHTGSITYNDGSVLSYGAVMVEFQQSKIYLRGATGNGSGNVFGNVLAIEASTITTITDNVTEL